MFANGPNHSSKQDRQPNRPAGVRSNAKTATLPVKSPFTSFSLFATLADMSKKILPLLLVPLLMGGCAASITNLTPKQQTRNSNNSYTVEVAFDSTQQAIVWDSIKPEIVVGNDYYEMHRTALMTNRWEGSIPIPPGTSVIHYRYKFDYEKHSWGAPKNDTEYSPVYTLHINEP